MLVSNIRLRLLDSSDLLDSLGLLVLLCTTVALLNSSIDLRLLDSSDLLDSLGLLVLLCTTVALLNSSIALRRLLDSSIALRLRVTILECSGYGNCSVATILEGLRLWDSTSNGSQTAWLRNIDLIRHTIVS